MTKQRRLGRSMVGLWVLMGIATGCNLFHGSRSEGGGDPGPGDLGGTLSIRVLGAGDDPAVPSEEEPISVVTKNEVVSPDGVELEGLVPIPKEGDPADFFVFDDQISGFEIQSAVFTHRYFDGKNLLQGDSAAQSAFRDLAQNRYYIPIAPIFKGMDSEIGPIYQQILYLDLTFRSGDVRRIELRFRTQPVLPEVSSVVSSLALPPVLTGSAGDAALSALQQAESDGFPFASERYINPTTRPLVLWFRPILADFQLATDLVVKLNWGREEAPTLPLFADDLHRVSRAALGKAGIRIDGQGPSKILFFDKGRDWQDIRLAPGESVEVTWLAFSSANEKTCHAEENTSVPYYFCENQTPFMRRTWSNDCTQEYLGRREDVPYNIAGSWVISTYGMIGKYSREIILSEDGAQPEDAIREGIGQILLSKEPLEIRGNSTLASLGPYSCQGVF